MKILNNIKRMIKSSMGLSYPTPAELRKRGVKVGENVSINTKNIDYGHGFLISIGSNVTIALDAVILAHDASTKPFLGYSKVGKVEIGNDVFIGAGAIVLPNVRIGNRVIVGAGCLVNRNIPENSVVVGNPARVIGSFDEYIEKNRQLMKKVPVYDTYWPNKTALQIEEMQNELQIGKIGFDI